MSTVRVQIGAGERVEAVGPYRVRGILGRGGMGVVYEVGRGGSDEVLALKTIEARFLELEDNNAGRRFSHEVSVLSKLDHPQVVRLHDYGFAQHPLGYELAFFVMDKLEGRSLDARLAAKARFGVAEVVRCALEVTEALIYLEAHGVLHRDIKPANLFQTTEGRIVLVDFGLARSAEMTRLTRAGRVIGTLAYMSPEALRAEETTSAVDVYALGAVLFEMMVGRPPFAAKDASQLVLLVEEGLRWPDGLRFEGDEAKVRDLVTDMLHPDPEVRPSPKEVAKRAQAIRRRLASRGAEAGAPPETKSLVAAAATGHAESAAAASAAVAATSPEPAPAVSAPPTSRPTWGVTAAIAAVSAGLAFAAGLSVGAGRSPPAPEPPVEVAQAAPARARPPQEVAPERPAPAAPPRFDSAQVAFEWGDRALKAGRHRAAISAFERTLQLNPALSQAHRRLGDAYLSLGELKAALRAYKTYRALKPNAPDAAQVETLIRRVER